VNDKRTGNGTYLYSTGEKYTGGFMNGKKHGIGISYVPNPDGKADDVVLWKEEWNHGNLVSRSEIVGEPKLNEAPGNI
jgi:hypothetical protein